VACNLQRHPTLENSLGKTVTANAEGTLEMRGVTKPVNVKLELRPIAAQQRNRRTPAGRFAPRARDIPIKLDDLASTCPARRS
jgi:hypothetical protein